MKLVKAGVKFRSNYQHAMTSFNELKRDIENLAEWNWVKTTDRFNVLQAIENSLRKKLTPWHTEYLLAQDMKLITNKYTSHTVTEDLTTMISTESMVAKLETVTRRLKLANIEMQFCVLAEP